VSRDSGLRRENLTIFTEVIPILIKDKMRSDIGDTPKSDIRGEEKGG